jgi:glycerol-3-phosphate dehydrogenase
MLRTFDLLVIGGGVNGAAIARDAAGRGIKVLLAEARDLASGTSQASSKLIHGGLRYLEHLEFRLVRESLLEREVLLRSAPHIIRPLNFVLPWVAARRSALKVRAGLFLYDRLGGRGSLPSSHQVNLRRTPWGRGLKNHFRLGFTYADCWVDDSRFVVLMAMDAMDRGAVVKTRTEVVGLRPDGKGWIAELKSDQGSEEVSAAVVVNATGVRADRVGRSLAGIAETPRVRLVKGSHIVVPRVHAGDHALILQNDDGRVVFVLPFERRFSLIGTTDTPIDDPAREHVVDEAEVDYLLRAVAPYLKQAPGPDDVVWTFAGTRPLKDGGEGDPSAASRDYSLELSRRDGAPILTVIGGKITTSRKLAEAVLARLQGHFEGAGGSWTSDAKLPGGDITDIELYMDRLKADFSTLDPLYLRRLFDRHGSLCHEVLEGCEMAADLGEHFGGDLFQREIDWLRNREWVVTGDDVLWRRTKCGLQLTPEQRDRVMLAMAG